METRGRKESSRAGKYDVGCNGFGSNSTKTRKVEIESEKEISKRLLRRPVFGVEGLVSHDILKGREPATQHLSEWDPEFSVVFTVD